MLRAMWRGWATLPRTFTPANQATNQAGFTGCLLQPVGRAADILERLRPAAPSLGILFCSGGGRPGRRAGGGGKGSDLDSAWLPAPGKAPGRARPTRKS